MASGLGVLAFDYAAPRRFIRPGETGWLAPFGDEETYLSTAAKVARSTEAWPRNPPIRPLCRSPRFVGRRPWGL